MLPAVDPSLRVVSIFSGAGGLDVGMNREGAAETVAMCESWEAARRVLASRFPTVGVAKDVRTFFPASPYDVLAAGFPCTDLSHAGGKAGIFGAQSGLVEHVFRIAAASRPRWIVLENVPNLLLLHGGLGIKTVTDRLEKLGYMWAYRTLDSRFTGVPQRRNRVIVVASRDTDPAPRLLSCSLHPTEEDLGGSDDGWGFYWTEGRTGLGLVRGATPTLKGGSTIGIPSAPAVWLPRGDRGRRFLVPSIEAGEALQGFEPGWTAAAAIEGEHDARWKIIGNAVTTGVGTWVARILTSDDGGGAAIPGRPVEELRRWPEAAYGGPGRPPTEAIASRWPELWPRIPITSLVDDSWKPLSYRAIDGFMSRLDEVDRKVPDDFAADLHDHLEASRPPPDVDRNIADAVVGALTRSGYATRRGRRADPDVSKRFDVVVASRKVVFDVRKCFWQGCPSHVPADLASNPRWLKKRERLIARDEQLVNSLTEHGWLVVVLWAHDDPAESANNALRLLAARRGPGRLRGASLGDDLIRLDIPVPQDCEVSELADPSGVRPPARASRRLIRLS